MKIETRKPSLHFLCAELISLRVSDLFLGKNLGADVAWYMRVRAVYTGVINHLYQHYVRINEFLLNNQIYAEIDKLQVAFHELEQTPFETGEHVHLTRGLITNCESIEWQVDELNKAIAVAARDLGWFGLDGVEIERRRRWTTSAHNQVAAVRKAVEAAKEKKSISHNGARKELMRLPNERSNYYTQDSDDLISSESDRQMLIIKQQDEELDELSASVQRIGGVGLTIHEELVGQERILNELSMEIETTANRLEFVQKKVAMVMKKAGAKGQIMMIFFLLFLLIIFFVLLFLT